VLPRLIRPLLWLLLAALLCCGPGIQPVAASLTNNTYDGNIYALYAGNGSLVPPRTTLAQALAEHRPAVVVYFLDDASASKRFASEVSELQRLWGNSIELIPLATDPLQNRPDGGVDDPAHYWKGVIPQVVVFDAAGKVVLDASGQVDPDGLNRAISTATGIALPEGQRSSTTISFNELNSEVISQP